MLVYAGTRDGELLRLGPDGEGPATVLEDIPLQCVAAAGARVLVGTRGRGALLSDDAGGSWRAVELPEADVFSVAISPADGALYAGTEPSRLFTSPDGASWSELDALQAIPSRPTWSFPPRPWTHHVRWIAPDPHRAERLLVGIELGGLMYSEDGGATFTDHRPGACRDVHNLAWHPTFSGRAYEAAGDGAAFSRDDGHTWIPAQDGRDLPYCWALAVDPEDPDHWYVSAAEGPFVAHRGLDAHGRLYEFADGAWRTIDVPGGSLPYALATGEGKLIAGMADGRILTSADDGRSWTETARTGSILTMAVTEP
jgi:photosystem II stability/assembly factor-like uncharacterized protein